MKVKPVYAFCMNGHTRGWTDLFLWQAKGVYTATCKMCQCKMSRQKWFLK